MYCVSCGSKLKPGDVNCNFCGTPVVRVNQNNANSKNNSSNNNINPFTMPKENINLTNNNINPFAANNNTPFAVNNNQVIVDNNIKRTNMLVAFLPFILIGIFMLLAIIIPVVAIIVGNDAVDIEETCEGSWCEEDDCYGDNCWV